MSRPHFERGLKQLQEQLLTMGQQVAKALREAADAARRRDPHLSRFVIEGDKAINRQRFEIEEQALTLIATQQPVVARDLRLVAAVLHIAGELERMGDHAKGIARINLLIQQTPPPELLDDLFKMATLCNQLLEQTLDAFLKLDVQAARNLARQDDEVDALYDHVFPKIMELMNSGAPQATNTATYLLWAAHNLERFGDRITNICERIAFVVTGELINSTTEHIAPLDGTLPAASASYELEG